MKKRLLLALLALFVVYGFGSQVLAYNPDYLPGGENYFSEDNFAVSGDNYQSIEPFLVKPYTEYLLSIPRDYENSNLTVYVDCYQNETLVSQREFTNDDFLVASEFNTLYVVFRTDSDTNYMSVAFPDFGYFSYYGFSGFMLEEGNVYDGYEAYIEGSLIDTTSPYFQSAGTVISYVDTPISVEEICSALHAYDAIDGDVSGSIIVTEDNYTAFASQLGTYSVVFAVADNSGNLSSIEVIVQVVDAVNPVFTDIGTVKAVFPNTYSLEEIKAMLTASDNYDGDLSTAITLVSDGYTESSSVVGSYPVEYSVSDSSGNEAAYTVWIEVVDEEAPLFLGTTEIVIGYDRQLSIYEVQSGLSVIDNYDEATTLQITIVSDSYSENHDLLGDYQIVFEVFDSSGNRSEQIVSVSVVDEIGPVVYFDCSIIQVYNDTVLSLGDIAYLLSKTEEIKAENSYNFKVVYDSYSRHASVPGTYHLALDIIDENGDTLSKSFQIRVCERPVDYYHEAPDVGAEDASGFWEKYNLYLLGGSLGGMLFISNIFWIIFMKKKKAF